MGTVGIVGKEFLAGVVGLMQLLPAVCPSIRDDRGCTLPDASHDQMKEWEIAPPGFFSDSESRVPELTRRIERPSNKRDFDAVQAHTGGGVFANGLADLLVDHHGILNDQVDVPALFSGVDEPINEMDTALVLKGAGVEPGAEFVKDEDPIPGFVVRRGVSVPDGVEVKGGGLVGNTHVAKGGLRLEDMRVDVEIARDTPAVVKGGLRHPDAELTFAGSKLALDRKDSHQPTAILVRLDTYFKPTTHDQ